MIVTLTANPSVDRTLEIPALMRGEVVRATASRLHPGGKGVNVARALVANGHPARAVLPVGGREGKVLLELLADVGVEVVAVPIREPVRENVTVVEPDGTVTKLNAPGPTLSPEDVTALIEATVEASRGAEWVALCGTLPPGAPESTYGDLVKELHGADVRVAVDASGPALAESIRSGPDVIKPNAAELAEVVGSPIQTVEEVVQGARGLLDQGVGQVLVSLGEKGAVCVSDSVVLRAWAPPVVPRSTVGAGDATLAGFLATDGLATEALRAAVAWGAASVRLPGTEMPGTSDIDLDEVKVQQLQAWGRTGRDGRRKE